MKAISYAVLTAAALTLSGPASSEPLELGAGIPSADITMKNVDGRMLSIDDVRGEKGTLVLFTCNACPWVKAWEERIASLLNEFAGKGVGVIAVNANDPAVVPEDGFEVMQRRAEARGFAFPYVVDATSDVARSFGATRTPEAFLFGPGGNLVYHGTIDDNAQAPERVEETYLRDALAAVVAGSRVPVQETKALGCTIKWRS